MSSSESDRHRLWLYLILGLLVCCQIGSFWLIFRLQLQIAKCGKSAADIDHAETSDGIAELRRQVTEGLVTSKSRERRQSGAQEGLAKVMMDLLKELCAPNEKFCIAGPKGEQGIPGHPGFPGHPGLKGDLGLPGEKGFYGKHGPRGNPGRPGLKGSNGDPGVPGIDGVDGRHGRHGPKGDPGHYGYPGASGRPGEKGSVGPKGDKGSTGNNGTKGDKGSRGFTALSSKMPSQCSDGNYRMLSDEWRKTSFSSVGKTVQCDRNLVSSWYRFADSIGGQMPETCPPVNSCGTHAPGWVEGSHPTVVGEEVSRTVCFHYSNNPCWQSTSTTILNCGSFFLYYLKGTPNCNYAYCASG